MLKVGEVNGSVLLSIDVNIVKEIVNEANGVKRDLGKFNDSKDIDKVGKGDVATGYKEV